MNCYKPGNVVLVDLGETVGHEQKGKRPAVIVSHEFFSVIIIVPLTTKEKPWWTVVEIEKGEGGLNERSFALCHQLRAISVKRITNKFGSLKSDTLNKIKTVLANIFELE
ncbi:MAG: type II toxin-antitoxin system PemK/MazF family toxin [candidate division WOR-3 bacterium]